MDRLAWERWARGFGVLFVVVGIVSFALFGSQPKVDDSASDVVSFFDGDSGRILVGLVLFGIAFILLAFFIGAVFNALRIAGEARLAATAVVLTTLAIAMELVTGAIVGAMSSSVAASVDDEGLLRALNTLAWSTDAMAAFPAAGGILAASVGLYRSRLLPSWYIWVGFAAGLLILLRGTNWASDGFWAPSGDYAFVAIVSVFAWTLVTSVLLYRAPVTDDATVRPAMTAG